MGVSLVKAHAYGNDFLFVDALTTRAPSHPWNLTDLVRRLCDRHQGVGADGLILYELRPGGATMQLFNADGSPSELSGNGLRCLAALVARAQSLPTGAQVVVDTDVGTKTLELLDREGERFTYRAALGAPEDIRQVSIPIDGESIVASVLRLGNPQCVVLGPLPDPERFNRLGPALATHPMFPAGTNVEFAHVEASDRVRILIWERGVGPTSSSGTGASASAVAAAAHGDASRDVGVIAPGGTQRVEWRLEGVYLTGWADVVFTADWLGSEL
jgi:diaminopimelate epimerase